MGAPRTTRRVEELVALIREGRGEAGIYQLAQAAGRPYRRVHDQVKRLEREGRVRIERRQRGARAVSAVRSVEVPPRLSFDRAWSRPSGGIDADTLIAQVLARPTFRDLLVCVDHYGLDRVARLRADMIRDFELAPGALETSGRMLRNIEVGRARAAGIH